MIRPARLLGRIVWGLGVTLPALSALLLAACDTGVPAGTPTPTVAAPALLSPTAMPDRQATEVSDALTEVPPSTYTPEAGAIVGNEQDQLALYRHAVKELLDKDKSGPVYISPYVGQGERLDDPKEDMPLPQGLVAYLQKQDGSRSFSLANFADVVGSLEEGGKPANGGVFITLGRLKADIADPSLVTLRAGIYRGVSNGEGNLYTFKADPTAPDGWTLLDTQQEWNEQQS